MHELLFKLFDLLLGGLLERRRERKALIQQFEALKRRVLYIGIVNDLPVELNKLRTFIIEKGLMESPGINEFFSKWLTNPMVVTGTAALNVFSKEALEELQGELYALQL
jgi:hypothetical protein